MIKNKWLIFNKLLFLIIILHIIGCEDAPSSVMIKEYGIVINEINYNSSDQFNSGDWIEIYNNSVDTIDIGLWIIKDNKDDHIFTIPINTNIAPEDYLIFCSDFSLFNSVFPGIDIFFDDLDFGLSGGSDAIRIFNNLGYLVDIVEYEDSSPWPSNSDGSGSTLELIHPSRDNSQSNNWKDSIGNGTPGSLNSVFNIDG